MKYLIFDAGPLINFSMNGLLPMLEKLKKEFKGQFIIFLLNASCNRNASNSYFFMPNGTSIISLFTSLVIINWPLNSFFNFSSIGSNPFIEKFISGPASKIRYFIIQKAPLLIANVLIWVK